MATVTLTVASSSYRWPLPHGSTEITALALKEDLASRAKLLYHTKLRLTPEGSAQAGDAEKLPMSPTPIKVAGPDSVLKMLELALKKGPGTPEPVRTYDAPRASAPAPRASPAPRTAPAVTAPRPAQAVPRSNPAVPAARAGAVQALTYRPVPIAPASPGLANAGRFEPWGGGGWGGGGGGGGEGQGVVPRRGDRVQMTGLKNRLDLNGTSGTLIDFDVASDRWQVRLDGVETVKLFRASNLLIYEDQKAAVAEAMEFDAAMRASRFSAEADEEEQLAWALAESQRLAQEQKRIDEQTPEEIRAFYEEAAGQVGKKVPSDQSTRNPDSTAVPWESDDEGFAWDSDQEEDVIQSDDDEALEVAQRGTKANDAPAHSSEKEDDDDDDDDLPPLEPLPGANPGPEALGLVPDSEE